MPTRLHLLSPVRIFKSLTAEEASYCVFEKKRIREKTHTTIIAHMQLAIRSELAFQNFQDFSSTEQTQQNKTSLDRATHFHSIHQR